MLPVSWEAWIYPFRSYLYLNNWFINNQKCRQTGKVFLFNVLCDVYKLIICHQYNMFDLVNNPKYFCNPRWWKINVLVLKWVLLLLIAEVFLIWMLIVLSSLLTYSSSAELSLLNDFLAPVLHCPIVFDDLKSSTGVITVLSWEVQKWLVLKKEIWLKKKIPHRPQW